MKISRYIRPPLAISLLSLTMIVGIIALATSPVSVRAAGVCNAAMVIDRSGSVGAANINTMKNQIYRLFEPTGLYNENINLAFWSFSALDVNTVNGNYNAPFSGFVSSKGRNVEFDARLNQLISNGATDYEQGFGYNNGVLNTRDGIDQIINQANIIVFMTDGRPNTPPFPQGADNNNTARNVARTAVLKHIAAGKIVVGGIIGNANQQRSLNFAINGNDDNDTNVFRVSTSYEDLSQKLKQVIGDQCDALHPQTGPYALTPIVTTSNTVVTGTDGATFSYNVSNESEEGNTSDPTSWTIKRLIVDRDQPADPLFTGVFADGFEDGYSCPKLTALVNDKATCDQIASGQGQFTPGNTSLDDNASGATTVVIDDQWPAGTKVCNVLTLSKPTEQNQPVERYSKAVCLTIGKRPSVQVWGGDLRVGRHFATDTNVVSGQDPSQIFTSITAKSDGKTYGSWAEYGVFSAGPVVGFASMAGLEGGYASSLPNTQEFWSKLTFANTGNQYGLFTDDDTGSGTIPKVKEALLAGYSVEGSLNGVNEFDVNNPDIESGVYQKDNGNLMLNGSTLARSKTVIINVPDGTVTIAGDLNYYDNANDPYTSINEIPRLVIIAKNIVIHHDVGHVSAWLISDDPGGGTITTCDAPGTLTVLVCSKQLQIDGPVMARHLSLRRTGGAGPGADASTPAEIINLPADTYLWSQSVGRSEARIQATSTVELPPYF